MAYGGKLELKGFEEYLAKIEAAGKSIVPAVKRAINESVEHAEREIRAGAAKHKLTGAVYNAIESKRATQDGNYIFGEAGVNPDHSKTAWHAVFQEYGAPTFPADPFIRPAFDKRKIQAIQRKVLKREGVPIE